MERDIGVGPFGFLMRTGALFWLVPVIIGLVGFTFGQVREYTAGRVAVDAVQTMGVVVEVERRSSRLQSAGDTLLQDDSALVRQERFRVTYAFTTEEGQEIQGSFLDRTREATLDNEPWEVGDPIEITYSASEPEVHLTTHSDRRLLWTLVKWGGALLGAASVVLFGRSVVRSFAAVKTAQSGEVVEGKMLRTTGREPPQIEIDLPDGRTIRSASYQIVGELPNPGETVEVYVSSRGAWWSGDFRSKV